jgi:hypothetical protein
MRAKYYIKKKRPGSQGKSTTMWWLERMAIKSSNLATMLTSGDLNQSQGVQWIS